jgi:uncharacterized membrane protein (UPF0127 family)
MQRCVAVGGVVFGKGRRRRLATAAARFEGLPSRTVDPELTVFEARRWAERRDGLAGLPDLPAGWGLHITPCRSIHMQGMQFPLDLVWLDRHGAVVKVTEGVSPGRFAACLRARSVIEVNAGQGQRFAAALGQGRR